MNSDIIIDQPAYSSDDGGWYCELWVRDTGKEVGRTEVCKTASAARSRAKALRDDIVHKRLAQLAEVER